MFCTFSSDQINNNLTYLENAFITEYLPILPDSAVRVYLYGLYLCARPLGEDNTFEAMCNGLQMEKETVKAALEQLKALGLIYETSTSPYIVKFNSPSKAVAPNRTYNKDKYADFLVDLHIAFGDRELSETEIVSFIDFLETTKMEQSALLIIIKYCIQFKDNKISRFYILTVAKTWFDEGVRTLSDAEGRVMQAEAASSEIREVLKALKSTRKPDITDRQLYLKWTTTMGFAHSAIIQAAKLVKRGGIEKLDVDLNNYFAQGIMSDADIRSYSERSKIMLDTVIKTVKRLGLYYEDCSFLVDTYMADWFSKGFDQESLVLIARYCALDGVRDYKGFADKVDRFYAEGYISADAIKLQLDALSRMDANIETVLYAAGSSRRVTSSDRDLYRTWTERWRLSDEQILEVAALAQGKPYAMSWISNRLADMLGGSPWRNVADPVKVVNKDKDGLGDFEKAEIKAKLKEDKDYLDLNAQAKKLEFEMSAFIVKDQPVPEAMNDRLNELKAAIDERIKALGYDPKQIK